MSFADNQTITEQYDITSDKVGNGKNITRKCGAEQSLTMTYGVAALYIIFDFKTNVTDNTYMLSLIRLYIDVSDELSSKNAKGKFSIDRCVKFKFKF